MLKLTRLKEARELAGLSQDGLAEASGVARATVADLELGKRMAQPRTARRLAEALEVEIRELLEEPAAPLAQAPSPPETSEEERRLAYLRSLRIIVEQVKEQWERRPKSADPTTAMGVFRALSQLGVLGGVYAREYLSDDEKLELMQLTPAVINLIDAAEAVGTEAQVLDELKAAREKLRPVA